jgi:type IV fimbrial biogenesis protein FimT
MRASSLRRAARGFTAIELMVVVAIVAILTALAAPYMGQMIRKQQLRTTSFDVFSSLTLARSEAIKRNVSVTMASVGGDWTKGWTVTDANGNVLRTQGAMDNLAINGPVNVVFTGTGRLSLGIVPFSIDTVIGSNTVYRCVSVDLSGRPVSKESAC